MAKNQAAVIKKIGCRENATKKSRKFYTEDKKLEIVAYAAKHGVSAAVLQFDVGLASVVRWRRLARLGSLLPNPNPPSSTDLEVRVPDIISDSRGVQTDSEINEEEPTSEKQSISKSQTEQSLNLETKMEMVEFAEKHGIAAAKVEFQVSEESVRYLRQKLLATLADNEIQSEIQGENTRRFEDMMNMPKLTPKPGLQPSKQDNNPKNSNSKTRAKFKRKKDNISDTNPLVLVEDILRSVIDNRTVVINNIEKYAAKVKKN